MSMLETASTNGGSHTDIAEPLISVRPEIDAAKVILVVTGAYNHYHSPIIDCLRNKVAPLGYGVLCVTGLEAGSGFRTSGIPSIYRIAAQLDVAGTIILASSLGHSSNKSHVFNVVDHFKHQPLVAIDLEGDNWSSVVYENAPPMQALVMHVLDNVASGDIAFLSGYTGGRNSMEREKAFRDGMAERGRQIDESLILCADFEASNGFQVVDQLLSSGRCPSAIIAANDAMAFGAIDALEQHGKRVPDDVLVSGFDDSEYANSSTVPISTVRACPLEQMDLASEELLRLIAAGDEPEFKKICLPVQLIIRASTTVQGVDVLLSDSPKFNGSIDPEVDVLLSEHPERNGSTQHEAAATTLAMVRKLAKRKHTDYLTNHQIREHLHVRLARCSDRESVYRAFNEGMQDLSINRAYLVSFEWASSGSIQSVSLLHTWPFVKISDAYKNYSPERLLPPDLEQELCEGALVMCGVEIEGQSVGALVFEQNGSERSSMDSLAQTTFAALRHFDQCDSLELQTYELECVNDELVRQANLDPLTGLANRSRLLAELEYSLEQGDDGIVIVFLDLDGFKPVNDTLGHAAGDHVLKQVGHRLSECLREYDVVARFGGDEFVVLLRNMHSADDIKSITQQLLSEVSRSMQLLPEQPISLTASVGVACNPEQNRSSNELLQRADTAMYRAKRVGGNRIKWYSEALAQEVDEQLRVEQAIHEGLNQGQFWLEYQPRVDLHSGSIVSVEALLRWRQADGVDVTPALFIKAAEQSGLIARLDAFSFRTACAVAADWYKRGITCRMSVNLSVARMQQHGLIDEIKSILLQHDLPPNRLELEVTETAAMTDIDANINTLETLRSMGLRLSIDDFGSEYSSLSYLRNLPLDYVKIDRMFLSTIVSSDATKNPDAQIMQAIIALGSGLGLKVVAEGVETEEQLNFLVNVGCDEAQGFLFSRPLGLEAIEAMLSEDSTENSWQKNSKELEEPTDKIVEITAT